MGPSSAESEMTIQNPLQSTEDLKKAVQKEKEDSKKSRKNRAEKNSRLERIKKKIPNCRCSYESASWNMNDFKRLVVVLIFSLSGSGLILFALVFSGTQDGDDGWGGIGILALGVLLFLTGKWILWWVLHYRKRRRHIAYDNWHEDNYCKRLGQDEDGNDDEVAIDKLERGMKMIDNVKCKYKCVDRSDHESGPCLLRSMSSHFRPQYLHTFELTAHVKEQKDGIVKEEPLIWKIRRSDDDFYKFEAMCNEKGLGLDPLPELTQAQHEEAANRTKERWEAVKRKNREEEEEEKDYKEEEEDDKGVARSKLFSVWVNKFLNGNTLGDTEDGGDHEVNPKFNPTVRDHERVRQFLEVLNTPHCRKQHD